MCKHEDKKLIDWTFSHGIHTSTYQCNQCGDDIPVIDDPIIYKYGQPMVQVNGVVMHKEDYEIIKEKERLIGD